MKYDLNAMATASGVKWQKKRPSVAIPAVRLKDDNAYRVRLQSLVKEARAYTAAYIVPAVAEERALRAQDALTVDGYTVDAFGASLSAALIGLRARLSAAADAVAQWLPGFLQDAGRYALSGFIRRVKSYLGVDLTTLVQYSDISAQIADAVAAGTALVGNLSTDIAHRIEQAILANIVNGQTQEDLARVLRDQFGIADSRAKLIAYDQMGKAYGAINRQLQTQAGLDRYIWTTMRDERVRPKHRALDNRICSWTDRRTSDGIQPGEEVRCRCWAVAVVGDATGRDFGAEPVDPYKEPAN